MQGLRCVIYDRTCRGRSGLGLSTAWWAGSWLYRALGQAGPSFGAASWDEALDWLGSVSAPAPIAEVQFWGHGKWGDARIGAELLDERALLRESSLAARLQRVRARLAPDALWWFRTCETFGALRGQRFARAFGDLMGCSGAGHTYVIAVWQSGLHALAPGTAADWDPSEGLAEGTPARPERALPSAPGAPNTITCFEGRIPDAIRPR